MSLRLIISFTALPGKGGDLARAYRERCIEVMKEPGCEQYEIFQSALDPDRLTLLERWRDAAALDAHAKLTATKPPCGAQFRQGSEREDYTYNRTR